ncbi:MAG: peptidylprolyl isomerase [Sphingomonadales bacterium]|nr:MAG: peptidylprolyl isomerase [Sphingomonadales bacterium]
MIRALMIALLALVAIPAAAQTAPAAKPNPRVAFETEAGRFVVEVYADKAPVTAANFLRYVDAKRLDGITFYRVVKVQDHFGFVQLGLQNDPKKVFPPIRHEPTTTTGIKHLDGTLSMPRLKPGAFARVIDGLDVVLKVFDAPNSPTATLRGGVFKGEVPIKPVKVLTVRRVAG